MLSFKLPKIIPPIENEKGLRNLHVIRIGAGGKFFIIKSTNIEWTIEEIRRALGKYQRGGVLETNLFYPFVKWVFKENITKTVIDILFTTTDGYQVLKYELEQLSEHFGKKECLNGNNIPHVPHTIRAKKGSSWLTDNQRMNYFKLLSKYEL